MSKMLEYKGYHATVSFDAEDELFIGEVFGLNDTLAFHGRSVDELVASFHSCIENYVQMCAEMGVEPEKEYKGSFNVRIQPELHRRAALAATSMGMTLNQYVTQAIEQYTPKYA